MEEFKPRISDTTMWLMIGVNLFFTTLQWLFAFIFLGWLVVIFSYLTFSLWNSILGIKFLERFGAKRLFAWVVVPIVALFTDGILPGSLITLIITIYIVKTEDKLVEKGVVTREELSQLNDFVIGLARKHGTDS